MSAVLAMGQNVSLSSHAADLQSITVGVGWRFPPASPVALDLDASALMLDSHGRVASDAHFIFFNNLRSPDGSVEHLGEAKARSSEVDDNERIRVDLRAVDNEVRTIVFAVSIYAAADRRQSFSQIQAAFIRIVDDRTGGEVARYELGSGAVSETAMIFGELYRRQGEWKFRAVGQGYHDGLAGIARDYGVSVGTSPIPKTSAEPASTSRPPLGSTPPTKTAEPASTSGPPVKARPTTIPATSATLPRTLDPNPRSPGCSIPLLFPTWYEKILRQHGRPLTGANVAATIDRTAAMIAVGAAKPYTDQLGKPKLYREFERRFQSKVDPKRAHLIPDDMIDFLWQMSPRVHEALEVLVSTKLPMYLGEYIDSHPGRLPLMSEY